MQARSQHRWGVLTLPIQQSGWLESRGGGGFNVRQGSARYVPPQQHQKEGSHCLADKVELSRHAFPKSNLPYIIIILLLSSLITSWSPIRSNSRAFWPSTRPSSSLPAPVSPVATCETPSSVFSLGTVTMLHCLTSSPFSSSIPWLTWFLLSLKHSCSSAYFVELLLFLASTVGLLASSLEVPQPLIPRAISTRQPLDFSVWRCHMGQILLALICIRR